jgi:hypothetical protein
MDSLVFLQIGSFKDSGDRQNSRGALKVSMTPQCRNACSTGVIDPGEASNTGINDTREAGIIFGLLLASINNTSEA